MRELNGRAFPSQSLLLSDFKSVFYSNLINTPTMTLPRSLSKGKHFTEETMMRGIGKKKAPFSKHPSPSDNAEDPLCYLTSSICPGTFCRQIQKSETVYQEAEKGNASISPSTSLRKPFPPGVCKELSAIHSKEKTGDLSGF